MKKVKAQTNERKNWTITIRGCSISKIIYNSTLTFESGHSLRALSNVGVQSFAIQRAAATIPQCACPKTKLLICPSLRMEW